MFPPLRGARRPAKPRQCLDQPSYASKLAELDTLGGRQQAQRVPIVDTSMLSRTRISPEQPLDDVHQAALRNMGRSRLETHHWDSSDQHRALNRKQPDRALALLGPPSPQFGLIVPTTASSGSDRAVAVPAAPETASAATTTIPNIVLRALLDPESIRRPTSNTDHNALLATTSVDYIRSLLLSQTMQ